MPGSHPLQSPNPPVADEDGESLDSIPWESIDTLGGGSEHRRWYLVAGAIVVAAIAISAVRTLGNSPAPAVPVTSTTVAVGAEDTVPTTTTTPTPEIVTEADLMAVEPHLLQWAAAAFAEVAAAEYFSGYAEGIWPGVSFDVVRSTFVEYAHAVEVTPRGPATFDVLVAVSVLDAAESEAFVRRPVRGVSIVVDASDGDFRPVALPSPAELPFRPLTPSGDGVATVVLVDEAGNGWPMDIEVERGEPRSTP